MDYRVRDKAVLSSLKRGDNIRATLVSDGKNWELENVILEPSH
jgi:Cu/Ag efflux protein CusF